MSLILNTYIRERVGIWGQGMVETLGKNLTDLIEVWGTHECGVSDTLKKQILVLSQLITHLLVHIYNTIS